MHSLTHSCIRSLSCTATGSQLYWWTDGNQNQPRDQLTKLNDPPTYAAAQMLAVMGIYTAPAGTLIKYVSYLEECSARALF